MKKKITIVAITMLLVIALSGCTVPLNLIGSWESTDSIGGIVINYTMLTFKFGECTKISRNALGEVSNTYKIRVNYGNHELEVLTSLGEGRYEASTASYLVEGNSLTINGSVLSGVYTRKK
ncbi:MAG: hypothetical protein ACTTHG_03805 [Treponemataceae bacterium]